MQNANCYLSKDSSDAVKGLLIILIVFGHNHVLAPNTENGGLMSYLYHFHVVSFFILPFFYQKSSVFDLRKILDIIIRCFVPYFWTCLLCWLVFSVFNHTYLFGVEHVIAFINGTQTPLNKCFGFIFPWFLPAFCSFSILLLIVRRWSLAYIILGIVSVITWFLSWETIFSLKQMLPFGFSIAIMYFGYGIFCFHINKFGKWCKYVGAVIFIMLSIAYWSGLQWGWAYSHILPISFFMLLLSIEPFIKCKWLKVLGQHSIVIYLLNVFIENAFFQFFPHTILWGGLGVIMAILMPLCINVGITYFPGLKKVILPRCINDFIRK